MNNKIYIIHHIIGQQISIIAQATVWKRMQEQLGNVNAQTVADSDIDTLQKCGMTFRDIPLMEQLLLFIYQNLQEYSHLYRR